VGEKQSGYGHCFTTSCNGIARSLPTKVGVESAVNPDKAIEINALWDTGASRSLIRPEVAQKLNLKFVGKAQMSTPSGKDIPSNIYVINIFLPNGVKVLNIPVLEGIPNTCDMLIGMDVISMGDFAVSNYNGRTMFSFRMPSMAEIDFCKHSYFIPASNKNKNVGRNDPCPCGSGKKFKQCCGK